MTLLFPLVAICVLGTAPDLSSALAREEAELPESEHVRRQSRDAANCLYVHLRSGGVEFGSAARAKIDAVRSFRDIEQVSAEMGSPLKAVRMSFRDLTHVGHAICFVEESVTGGGQFVIAMASGDRLVWVIHGGTATITQFTEDEFRRIWRGFAMTPARPGRGSIAASFEFIAVLGFGWWLGRFARRVFRTSLGRTK